MSIPKEPRQLMINLMYLVLTALLALNVSNEILNAFKTLSLSIDKSNRSIDQKNTEVYNQILDNEKQPGQAEKVKPFRERADEVVKRANAMVAILNDWKKRITIEAGGFDKNGDDTTLPSRLDNIDATTHLLVENRGGDTLKKEMADLRTFLLNQVLAKDSASISPLMPLRITNPKPNDHNPTGDWSIGNFEHMPAIAAIALFSKYQNDVRSSQSLVLNQLYDEAHLKDIKFDTITAIAVPKTSYALEGDKIEASILLAAFNKSNKPEVHGSGGGGSFKPAENGVIPWETIAHGTGLQTVQGTITLNNGDAGVIVRPWKFEYMVGTTGASMQLDKMNVFYIGVANPVTVAAAGYSVQDVSLDIPGADIRPDSSGRLGHYNIWVSKPGTVDVTINAKKKEGGITKVGGMTIRVKRIPDPIIKVGGVSSGGMDAAKFRIQPAPGAILENFEFAARYQIVSFQFYMLPKGKDIVGPYTAAAPTGTYFSSLPNGKDIQAAIKQARAGDRVFIDEVKVVGPDGLKRSVQGVSLLLY